MCLYSWANGTHTKLLRGFVLIFSWQFLYLTQYFAPLILHNAHYRVKLRQWFDGPDIFAPLFHYFFRPVPDVINTIGIFVYLALTNCYCILKIVGHE